MLRALFSSVSGRQSPESKTEKTRNMKGGRDSETSVDMMVNEEALSDAKREIYQFKVPDVEVNFSTLENTYTPGNRFQYVAISNKDHESTASRIRRLITLKSGFRREEIPLSKLPNLKLISDTEQFLLSQALPKYGKEYIRLKSVTGIFTPLDSAHAKFSTVKVSLHDKRKGTDDSMVQSSSFNSNLSMKFELSMDYCIPRCDAKQIVLNFCRESAVLGPEFQWAAVKMQIKLEESEFPFTSNLQPAIAVMALPSSTLDIHETNPNHINTTILEANRLNIRDMYENGDIADESEPIENNSKPVTYSKSTLKAKVLGVKSNVHAGEGWEHLKDFRMPRQEVGEASKAASSATNDLEDEEILQALAASKLRQVRFTEKQV